MICQKQNLLEKITQTFPINQKIYCLSALGINELSFSFTFYQNQFNIPPPPPSHPPAPQTVHFDANQPKLCAAGYLGSSEEVQYQTNRAPAPFIVTRGPSSLSPHSVFSLGTAGVVLLYLPLMNFKSLFLLIKLKKKIELTMTQVQLQKIEKDS